MRLVTVDEYLELLSKNSVVRVEDQEIPLEPIEVRRLEPSPDELADVSTTVWSFPKRGSWATHRGDYRGNWPPQMARALIERYTGPGETVLDPMSGSGTTCIEAKLLGRSCIAVDINRGAAVLTMHRLYWLEKAIEEALKSASEKRGGVAATAPEAARLEASKRAWFRVYHGDSRRLDEIPDNSVDLVATHPPYFNIIEYSERTEGDLSRAGSLEEYMDWFSQIAGEVFRVLKPGRHLGILVGDTRIHRHYVPITHHVLRLLLKTGFILVEEVIKIQHKMKTTREVWSRIKRRGFLLIYHEKLFILRKPANAGEYKKNRYSAYIDL